MLSLPTNSRVYLHVAPTDMRKSFDGLCGLVQSAFQQNVLDGHLFLFLNRRRDCIKALFWDRDGLVLFYKRLEAGTFEMPKLTADQTKLELDAQQLTMLLAGVPLASPKRRRYSVAGGISPTESDAASQSSAHAK